MEAKILIERVEAVMVFQKNVDSLESCFIILRKLLLKSNSYISYNKLFLANI